MLDQVELGTTVHGWSLSRLWGRSWLDSEQGEQSVLAWPWGRSGWSGSV